MANDTPTTSKDAKPAQAPPAKQHQSRRSRIAILLCKPGVILAAAAYLLLAISALLECAEVPLPKAEMHAVAYTVLAGLLAHKVYKVIWSSAIGKLRRRRPGKSRLKGHQSKESK